ncbi:MAG: DUF6701 domain-containing protein [Vibrio sp.]
MRSYLVSFGVGLTLFLSSFYAWSEVPPDERCFFPAAVQGWSTSARLTIGGDSRIRGTDNNSGRVGADRVMTNGNNCDGRRCTADRSLLIEEPPVLTLNPGSADLTNIRRIQPGRYDSLLLERGTFEFTGGEYHFRIIDLRFDAIIKVTGKTRIIVNRILIGPSVTFQVKDNAPENFTIWAENYRGTTASVRITGFSSFVGRIISRGTAQVDFNSTLVGSITSNTVNITSNSTVTYGESSCAPPPPRQVINESISVQPIDIIALTCQDSAPTIRVHAVDIDGGLVAIRAIFTEPTEAFNLAKASTPNNTISSSAPNIIFATNDSGIINIQMTPRIVEKIELNKKYNLEFQLVNNPNIKTTATITYVPFKFDIPDQSIIAGRPASIPINVLACDTQTNSQATISHYSGKPAVIFSIEKPINGTGKLMFAPEFKGGSIVGQTGELLFDNAGVLTLKIQDNDFNCLGIDGCPIGGTGILAGMFTVSSRPWTFSICDPRDGGSLPNGTSSGGEAFVASAEPFDLLVRPINWFDDGDNSDDPDLGLPVDVTQFCAGNENIQFTTNFERDNEAGLRVVLSTGAILTPQGGRLGAGIQGRVTYPPNTRNKFKGLRWREAGSIRVQIDTDIDYFGTDINQGFIHLGRFYPARLRLLDNNQWRYKNGLNDFAYMNQGIGSNIVVQALNYEGGVVENYGLREYTLRSDLKLIAVDGEGNSIEDERIRFSNSAGWADTDTRPRQGRSSQFIIDSDDFRFIKKEVNATPYTSVPDGPYNSISGTKLGVVVTNVVDGVDLELKPSTAARQISWRDKNNNVKTGLALDIQPDFRYGRLVLDDVSGTAGESLSVPLRVEYWNGRSFVSSNSDSFSRFQASESYSLVNSTTMLKDSTRDEIVTVNNGRSNRVRAVQQTPRTEVIRLFLDQDGTSIKQPWLQYNWRGMGDENPSTLVSFFRSSGGNNRVLFRGDVDLPE